MFSPKNASRRKGVALIIVVFFIALGAVVVSSMSYSAHLSNRLEQAATRLTSAEFLLKSAINAARVLIREDATPEDSARDITWGPFVEGKEIPGPMLGLPAGGPRVSIEIRPEESKLPLRAIVPTATSLPDKKWRDIFLRLFRSLGFDNDGEKTVGGRYAGKVFSAEEMVVNFIDYVDQDKDSYADPDGGFAAGIESDLPEGTFPNEQIKRISELATIPGFTAARIRRLTPFVTVFGAGQRININVAPRIVIASIHEDLPTYVDAIIEFRNKQDGPFTHQNKKVILAGMLGDDLSNQVDRYFDAGSRWYQVIAKVDYGASIYFARAIILKRDMGMTPDIRNLELY